MSCPVRDDCETEEPREEQPAVFAQPWRPAPTAAAAPWKPWDCPRARAALVEQLEQLHAVVEGRRTPRPVLARYVGRPGFETWSALGDVGELAGGRTGEPTSTFDPLP